jgi:hypothetical protein
MRSRIKRKKRQRGKEDLLIVELPDDVDVEQLAEVLARREAELSARKDKEVRKTNRSWNSLMMSMSSS